MKVGILQPYFLPAPAYFDLIRRTDRWIVFDTSQYRRHGWINRNRILHPEEGWQYVKVPLQRHHRETPIHEIRVAETAWAARLLAQLEHYRRAPHFEETMAFLGPRIASLQSERSLVQVDLKLLVALSELLEIPFAPELYSELAPTLELGPVEHAGQWALRICEALGASAYLNPPGGAHLFVPAEFEAAGIALEIVEPPGLRYPIPGRDFEPMLSVIDALMWLGAAGLRAALDEAA